MTIFIQMTICNSLFVRAGAVFASLTLPLAAQIQWAENFDTGGNLGGWEIEASFGQGFGVTTLGPMPNQFGVALTTALIGANTSGCPPIRCITTAAGGAFLGDYNANGINYLQVDAGLSAFGPSLLYNTYVLLGHDNNGTPGNRLDDWVVSMVVGEQTFGAPLPVGNWVTNRCRFDPCADQLDRASRTVTEFFEPTGLVNENLGWRTVIRDVDWVAFVFAEVPLASCPNTYNGTLALRIDNIEGGREVPQSVASCFGQTMGATLAADSYSPCNGGNQDGGIRLVANADPALANEFGFLLMGTATMTFPVFSGTLCVAGPQFRFDPVAGSAFGPEFNSLGFFDSSGQFRRNASSAPYFDLPVRLPASASLMTLGLPYYVQMWHRLPGGGATFSNMLEVRFH
jgi:hypothetical protein